MKQHYEKTGKFLRAYTINKEFVKENNVDFRALPVSTAQQVVMLADQNHRTFFQSVKRYSKSKQGYKSPPRPPKYKHKTKGRCVIQFSYQHVRINKRDGLLHFPKKSGIPHMKTRTKENIKEVRVVPKSNCYVIEIIYTKEINYLQLNKQNVASIDLGINNLCAVTVHQQVHDDDKSCVKSFLINGRPIKSMNQYYNKKKALALSQIMKQEPNRRSTRETQRLDLKRGCKIKNYFHHTSKYIIEFCKQNNIGTLVIGKNDGWKQEVNIGKKNNQAFVDIPYEKLIWQLRYKSELVGIEVIEINESYTSKCSALDFEPIEKQENYLGKRKKRGLFYSRDGTKINADINGSLNILRKATGDGFIREATSCRGYVIYPVSVVPTQMI